MEKIIDFYECCRNIANAETGSEEIAHAMESAFVALSNILTDVYMVSDGGSVPLMMSKSNVKYADFFQSVELADKATAEMGGDYISIIMPDAESRLKVLYENGFDAIVVHLDDGCEAVLQIDTKECAKSFDAAGLLMRPDLMTLFDDFEKANQIKDGNEIAELTKAIYDTFSCGNLYAIRNTKTGEILHDKTDSGDDVILTFTDMDEVELSSVVFYAEEEFGKGNVEAAQVGLEEIGVPSCALYINNRYYINKEVVANAIITTAKALRALDYINKQNTKNNITLDGEDLLLRLLNYPQMYLEFVQGINGELEFAGTITARAQGYSGSVIFETTCSHNAAAVYSIMEKLTTHPNIYLHDFEIGKLTY